MFSFVNNKIYMEYYSSNSASTSNYQLIMKVLPEQCGDNA